MAAFSGQSLFLKGKKTLTFSLFLSHRWAPAIWLRCYEHLAPIWPNSSVIINSHLLDQCVKQCVLVIELTSRLSRGQVKCVQEAKAPY